MNNEYEHINIKKSPTKKDMDAIELEFKDILEAKPSNDSIVYSRATLTADDFIMIEKMMQVLNRKRSKSRTKKIKEYSDDDTVRELDFNSF